MTIIRNGRNPCGMPAWKTPLRQSHQIIWVFSLACLILGVFAAVSVWILAREKIYTQTHPSVLADINRVDVGYSRSSTPNIQIKIHYINNINERHSVCDVTTNSDFAPTGQKIEVTPRGASCFYPYITQRNPPLRRQILMACLLVIFGNLLMIYVSVAQRRDLSLGRSYAR